MPSASASPFARPGSHAGSTRLEVDFPSAAPQAARSSSCNSTISSIDDPVFPPDVNTLTSWEVIDPACDEEVTGITNGQSQPQVNRPANVNTDSDPFNQDLGLKQVSDTNYTNNLGTLYNQDFFVADTMNRRLSQIPNKMNYPYPLPNGHAALQLRLPDLLIYLKTDTYLMDVNTGEHYAIMPSITSQLVKVFASGGNIGSSIDDIVELQLDDLAACGAALGKSTSDRAEPARLPGRVNGLADAEGIPVGVVGAVLAPAREPGLANGE